VTGSVEDREDWEQDERYRQLVELAPDAILIHDGTRIVLANDAVLRLAGATRRDQLLGLPIDRFLDPPFLKAVETELVDSVVPAEPTPPVQETFRRLDGSEVQVEVRAVGFLDRGHPSVHAVIRDITERLAVEEQARVVTERLQQAQRMEAVGALAGGVAHEVNNMMGVILGFSDFLLRDERLSPDCLADVREIMKAADRAAAVTRQLLAFGRRAAHRPTAVDLAALARATEGVIRRLLGEDRHLVVITNAAAQVWVDAGQLEQVIVNLALNARDAMAPGGTLTIIASVVDLPGGIPVADCGAVSAGRFGTLSVHDTGVGMDPATRARIFEPFFTTKPLGQGTGLGLAAAEGIVRQHSGCITVTTAPGQGTTFTIYLPEHSPQVGAERRKTVRGTLAEEAPTGETILVVDDEPGVCAIASRCLRESGFRVLQAHDGHDALELVDRYGPPGLVLTDLTMPGIGGAELARRLRDRWPNLPILFMSGHALDEYSRQTLLPGTSLIEKPFSPAALVAGVAAALAAATEPVTG